MDDMSNAWYKRIWYRFRYIWGHKTNIGMTRMIEVTDNDIITAMVNLDAQNVLSDALSLDNQEIYAPHDFIHEPRVWDDSHVK